MSDIRYTSIYAAHRAHLVAAPGSQGKRAWISMAGVAYMTAHGTDAGMQVAALYLTLQQRWSNSPSSRPTHVHGQCVKIPGHILPSKAKALFYSPAKAAQAAKNRRPTTTLQARCVLTFMARVWRSLGTSCPPRLRLLTNRPAKCESFLPSSRV